MDHTESHQIHSAGQGTPLKVAERPASRLDRIGGDYINSTGWYDAGQLHAAADDPMVSRMQNYHSQLHSGFKAIREALLVKDPQLTPEAHLLAVQRKSRSWLNTMIERSDAVQQQAGAEVKALDSAIRAKVGTPTQHAAEIRTYLRGLDPETRHSAMEEAAKAGDTATMAAMLDAPGYLSGLNPKQQDAFRQLYLEAHAKELLDRRSAVELAKEVNAKAVSEAMSGCEQFFDQKTIGEIVAGSEKAAAARDAIDKSLSA